MMFGVENKKYDEAAELELFKSNEDGRYVYLLRSADNIIGCFGECNFAIQYVKTHYAEYGADHFFIEKYKVHMGGSEHSLQTFFGGMSIDHRGQVFALLNKGGAISISELLSALTEYYLHKNKCAETDNDI